MFDFMHEGGDYMYFLLLFAIIVIGLAIKKVIDLFFKQNLSQLKMESGINAIVFWGGISFLVGFFAHFTGLYKAMQAIAEANDISPAIVAQGYGLSLITILTGMFIFIFSLLLWFILRWRIKKLSSNIE